MNIRICKRGLLEHYQTVKERVSDGTRLQHGTCNLHQINKMVVVKTRPNHELTENKKEIN